MRVHTLEQMKQTCQSSRLQTLFKKSHQIWSASRILDVELDVIKNKPFHVTLFIKKGLPKAMCVTSIWTNLLA